MKKQISNVLTIFLPLGFVVGILLHKPALGCIVFAIGFIATLETIKQTNK